MSNQNAKTEEQLRKLGQRVRQNWAKKHPIPEKQMENVHDAIRKECEREQAEKGIDEGGKQPRPPEPPELEP